MSDDNYAIIDGKRYGLLRGDLSIPSSTEDGSQPAIYSWSMELVLPVNSWNIRVDPAELKIVDVEVRLNGVVHVGKGQVKLIEGGTEIDQRYGRADGAGTSMVMLVGKGPLATLP